MNTSEETNTVIKFTMRWNPVITFLSIILGVLVGLSVLFVFYGNFRADQKEKEMNIRLTDLIGERDKAQQLQIAAQANLGSQVRINIDLQEKLNNGYNENKTIISKVDSLTKELHQINSRAKELAEYSGVELFDNQVILCLYEIITDSSLNWSPELVYRVNAAIYYIESDDRYDIYESENLHLGDELTIKKGSKIYAVRLISIDHIKRKAIFSHYLK